MKSLLLFIPLAILMLSSCESNVKESTIHRRNFSKNVFEEEFASVQVGCDTIGNQVLLPNTKWLSIDSKHLSKNHTDQHLFELNKKLELEERTYKHELVLERIQNGAFLFRYKGFQTIVDTLPSIKLSEVSSIVSTELDSSKIFSFEGVKYYKLNDAQANSEKATIIYKAMKTEDQGRVVCKCDYYF